MRIYSFDGKGFTKEQKTALKQICSIIIRHTTTFSYWVSLAPQTKSGVVYIKNEKRQFIKVATFKAIKYGYIAIDIPPNYYEFIDPLHLRNLF